MTQHRVLRRIGNQLIITEGKPELTLAELVPYSDVQESRAAYYTGRHFGTRNLREARKKAEWVRYQQTLAAFQAAVRGEVVRYP